MKKMNKKKNITPEDIISYAEKYKERKYIYLGLIIFLGVSIFLNEILAIFVLLFLGFWTVVELYAIKETYKFYIKYGDDWEIEFLKSCGTETLLKMRSIIRKIFYIWIPFCIILPILFGKISLFPIILITSLLLFYFLMTFFIPKEIRGT